MLGLETPISSFPKEDSTESVFAPDGVSLTLEGTICLFLFENFLLEKRDRLFLALAMLFFLFFILLFVIV